MTATDITAALHSLADAGYRQFAASLIPSETDLLGVRLPALRRLAKQAAHGDWQQLFTELQSATAMEPVMLRGMLPGYAPHATTAERLAAIADFVPAIRNWSICDSCCTTYKFTARHRSEVLPFLLPYLRSPREYAARFGTVMLLNHFLPAPEWVPTLTELLPQVTCSAYYAQMAVAWCACELCLSYPQSAPDLLPRLSPAVQQLTHRKIRESRRK